jgi:hypothetical protein
MSVSSEQFMEVMLAQKMMNEQMKMMNEQILEQIKEMKRGAKEDGGREEPPGLENKKKKEEKEGERRIDIKHMKMNSFNGTAESYEDWAFAFKRAIRMSNKKAYNMLIQCEEMTDIIVDENDVDPDKDFPGI